MRPLPFFYPIPREPVIRVLLLILSVSLCPVLHAAEWQYSVDTNGKGGRAFLWIPPNCERVRGIVLGQQVILEKVVLEDPAIRAAAAKESLAILFIVPACIGDYDEHGKGAETLQKILDGLASVSGYEELSQAPFLPMGHSGGAIFAWNTAYWNPDRCFGVIGLKSAPIHAPAYAAKSKSDGTPMLDDVPVLDISGQYEAWGMPGRPADMHWKWVRGTLLEFRAIGHNVLMSELVEPGVTHFGWDDELARYVAMFISKAAHARIPANPRPGNGPPPLNHISESDGWLADPTFFTPPGHPAAPALAYTGDPSLALWHIDGEIARANEAYGSRHKGKRLQMVTFVQDGQKLPSAWIEELRFAPQDDGRTVKVMADFVAETPPEMSFPVKRSLGHAQGPIRFRLIGGWAGGGEQTGPDTFRIKPDRFGFSRSQDTLMVMAYHPGDQSYARAEQAAQIKYPRDNTEGRPQQITFAEIPGQQPGSHPIPLAAVSDSGLPVDFCVIEGPAEIENNTLRLTGIPPRSRFPVKVTVVATQWGRSVPPLVRSAVPVFRSFEIHRHP